MITKSSIRFWSDNAYGKTRLNHPPVVGSQRSQMTTGMTQDINMSHYKDNVLQEGWLLPCRNFQLFPLFYE